MLTERNALILAAIPTCRSVALRYAARRPEILEDLVQSALLHLLVVIERYDPHRAPWKSFVWQYARQSMQKSMAKVGVVHAPERHAVPIATTAVHDYQLRSTVTPETVATARETMAQLQQRVSRRQLSVLLALADEHDTSYRRSPGPTQVAKRAGVSRQRVHQIRRLAIDAVDRMSA